jgi:hypothetical protein
VKHFDTVWLSAQQAPGGQPMESKKVPAPVVIPAKIQELSRHIEQWRSTRPHRMPMPEPLWTLAANLASQYGVAQVSRFLRLDYYSLKERVEPAERHDATVPESRPAGPTFIELPPLSSGAVSECSIELENPRGPRMRIHVKGSALPDLAALTRTFWGMKR